MGRVWEECGKSVGRLCEECGETVGRVWECGESLRREWEQSGESVGAKGGEWSGEGGESRAAEFSCCLVK